MNFEVVSLNHKQYIEFVDLGLSCGKWYRL